MRLPCSAPQAKSPAGGGMKERVTSAPDRSGKKRSADTCRTIATIPRWDLLALASARATSDSNEPASSTICAENEGIVRERYCSERCRNSDRVDWAILFPPRGTTQISRALLCETRRRSFVEHPAQYRTNETRDDGAETPRASPQQARNNGF